MRILYCEHACGIPIEIRIYSTLRTMQKGMRRYEACRRIHTKPRSLVAVTYSDFRDGILTKVAVFFNKEHLGAGIVAHEFCHLTFSLVRHLKRIPQPLSKPVRCSHEEFFAMCHENVTKTFWNWYYEQFPQKGSSCKS